MGRSTRKAVAFYFFVAPWLLGFIALSAIPLVAGFLTSLTNYDGFNVDRLTFVGASNYQQAFTSDPDVSFSFMRTLVWSAMNVPLWVVSSFVLALMLNQEIRGRDVFRTLYYLPSVVPMVAAARVWMVFLHKDNGLVNAILSVFRPGTAIDWTYGYAILTLTIISVWGGLGRGMVIFLAGLQGIPEELEEAARIDGATRLRVFQHITIPLMTPVIFFQLVMSLINSLQAFAVPLLIYGDGKMSGVVPRAAYLYVVHTYRNIFVYDRWGYGIALLWLLFVVILGLTMLVFRSARYWVYYEEEITGGGG